MTKTTLTEQERKILDAARAYGDAMAVLRGKPPFSVWDMMKIDLTRRQLCFEALMLSAKDKPGPSIPDGSPPPPDLKVLMDCFLPRCKP
jgi:hypothetical protein